jgi:hypothetical protein
MICRSQWPRGRRHRSTPAHLLRSCVRIPPKAWLSVSRVYCVLSGRGLCDKLITRPEESYRLWCVFVCDQEKQTLVNEEVKAHWEAVAPREREKVLIIYILLFSQTV